MRLTILFFTILLCNMTSTNAQEVDGLWRGEFSNQTSFYLSIEKDSLNLCASYLDVPSQGIEELKASSCEQKRDSLNLKFPIPFSNKYAHVNLKITSDSLIGNWKQHKSSPIVLYRTDKINTLQRPQTPSPPYNYRQEEIIFLNDKDSLLLAGTFTYPKSKDSYPTVILIAGSGPQERNSTFFKHQPFWVIADYFSSRGIGVLRFDERGIGKSQGNHQKATSEDFAYDVKAAVEYLSKLGHKEIGLVGHSEGGMIAQICNSLEVNLDFIISLAGPGIPIKELMLIQNEMAIANLLPESEAENYIEFLKQAYELIRPNGPVSELYGPLKEECDQYYDSIKDKETAKMLSPSKEAFYFAMSAGYLSPWFRYFINYDPDRYLSKITIPFLALNGTKDIQVTCDENLKGIWQSLIKAENEHFTIVSLEDLNHLFQVAETGSISEYSSNTETFNTGALDLIIEWIENLD